jgi:thiamine biosynthesis lipoprotein
MIRRARPLLGTLVEIGAASAAAVQAGFAAIASVERALSKFVPSSDIARFNAAPAGAVIEALPDTAAVLELARMLSLKSGGAFDITQGSGEWRLDARNLYKLSAGARIDPGGIGKGYAVDRAFDAASAFGDCWVNAGGDLRVSDGLELPVVLRDETHGGVRPFLLLSGGAIATSRFASGRHVSVAAPLCVLADALTKCVELASIYGATVWQHA